MAGTKAGGQKILEANLARDPDFYKKIGAKGGSKSGISKGFGVNRKLAVEAGRRGGLISRRGTAKKVVEV